MVMKIGMIGTGNIAPVYIKGCSKFPNDIKVVGCADVIHERAEAFAKDHNLQAQTVEDLLQNEEIDLIINLTIPPAHAEVSLKIIEAGKHVYVEKPLALNRNEGIQVLDAAKSKGVRVGCAPDTFLGAGGQTCRDIIQRGDIGIPVAATAFMMVRGHESWHPNPAFYYQPGGGPMFDMGPYYLTALVNLMGPMNRVSAMTKRTFDERIAQHEDIQGQVIPVNVDTHIAGTASFVNGAIATIIMSFDVWTHNMPFIEIYGTKGTLSVPDPNTFGGDVTLWDMEHKQWQPVEKIGRSDIQRGIGVVDMARAIVNDRSHLASGDLAYHVLDAMQAFTESAEQGTHIELTSQVDQPAMLEL
jgi:predicted dehydrogenase